MIDGIIAGTGDSRSLYGSLPSTYAEFKAAVEAGTQYVDVSYNAAGWQQEPTFLNKANLLTDAVAALFGLTPNATVNDAFNAASGLIGAAQTTANGRLRGQTGSYTGAGVSGSSNPNSLSFSFTPKLVIIRAGDGQRGIAFFGQTSATPSSYGGFDGVSFTPNGTDSLFNFLHGKLSGTALTWYYSSNDGSLRQMNSASRPYYWLAIG